MKKADYSRIASTYDIGRKMSAQNLDLWLELIASRSKIRTGARVLDLGCGTGRFALPMATRLQYNVTGVDFSADMLTRAAAKDTERSVAWIHQDARSLSLSDNSFDLVFISHLLHHVDSPLHILLECYRVLAGKGAVLIRYGAMEQIRDDVEHRFFKGVIEIDKARTPSVNDVEALLEKAGFHQVQSEEIIQQTYENGNERLEAVKAKAHSALSMIPSEVFEQGILDFERYIDANPDDRWLLVDRLTLTRGFKKESSGMN